MILGRAGKSVEKSVDFGSNQETSHRRRLRLRENISVGVIFLISSAFYLWTVTSGAQPLQFGGAQSDYYNQLTNGFLHGELSIPTLAPVGLLKLADPYSPLQNGAYQGAFHDLSLYHGHFFLSWGPTPVLTLFLPWRLLQIGGLPQNLAVWIYSIAGLAFSFLLLKYLVDRYIPQRRTWQIVIAAIALTSSSVTPFLQRRPAVYEVAISCTYCFMMGGLYFLARGCLSEGPKRRYRLLGSFCLGLAAGGHIDAVAVGVFILSLLVLRETLTRREEGIRVVARSASILVLPFGLVMMMILWYNYARFGSPFQYGELYQLAGVEQMKEQPYRFGYLPPGLYYYLAAPPRLSLAFPYVQLAPPPFYPWSVPTNYTGVEVVSGIFASTPITLALLLGIARWRRVLREELAQVILALSLSGLLLVLILAFAMWGATMRYEVDYATLLLVPAILIWLNAIQVRSWKTAVTRVVGIMAVLAGCVSGLAFSITGYYDGLRSAHPSTYAALERLTGFIPTVVTMLTGHAEIARVTSPNPVSSVVGYTTINAGANLAFSLSPSPTTLEIVAPNSGFEILHANLQLNPAGLTLGKRNILISISSNGYQSEYHFQPGIRSIKVRLSRGVNMVNLSINVQGLPNLAGTTPVVAFFDTTI